MCCRGIGGDFRDEHAWVVRSKRMATVIDSAYHRQPEGVLLVTRQLYFLKIGDFIGVGE